MNWEKKKASFLVAFFKFNALNYEYFLNLETREFIIENTNIINVYRFA